MGICMKRVLMLWGDPPDAHNLIFTTLNKSGLDIVTKSIRDEVVGARFPEIKWFSAGLTLKQIIELRPSIDVLKVFKVTVSDLIENKAHDVGANWQIWFGWTPEEWVSLGYDRNDYVVRVKSDYEASQESRSRRLQWGPKNGD